MTLLDTIIRNESDMLLDSIKTSHPEITFTIRTTGTTHRVSGWVGRMRFYDETVDHEYGLIVAIKAAMDVYVELAA